MAKYDVFSATFSNVATSVLKLDEKAVDEMAFTIVGLAPDCKQTNVQELSKSFSAAVKKYGEKKKIDEEL